MSGTPAATHIPLGGGAEFEAIRTMLREWGARARGIGDDAAIVDVPDGEQLVASTDASVEGVHFRRDWLTAEEIGARAASAALSDLAAMAARPLAMLLALGVPTGWREELVDVARGVGAAAERADCAIVGGNVTRSRELSLTITVLGSAAAPLRRSGARAGDELYVTGVLGGPGAALRALLAGRVPAPADLTRFVAPVPRLREARWLAEHGATAAIDISDGLLGDAEHLARASGVTLSLDRNAIPCVHGVTAADAMSSGEEYELLVAMPAGQRVDPARFAATFGIPVTRIGVVVAAGAKPVRVEIVRVDSARGHDHLS